MRDYGLMPFELDRLTYGELESVLRDQDARWKAIKDDQKRAQRQRQKRR